MKKLLSILAVLAIVATTCIMGIGTVLAAPAESSPDDFFVYDGVLEEYVGEGGDVVIPASLGVKEIAAKSFFENKDITSLVIPEGVKTIGSKAFFYCENLASVTFPYSLQELDQHEFSGCALTEVTIPGKCSVISYGCFSSCTYLEKVILSYGVEEIMPYAFQGTSVGDIVFPETVDFIAGTSLANNKGDDNGTIEYYICNPNCEIGTSATTVPLAQKKQWDEEVTPWSHNKAAATYKVYVVEGSEADKYLTEKGQDLLVASKSGKNDTLKIYRNTTQFFKDLPENQRNYGIQKPTTTTGTTNGTGNGGTGTDGGNGGTGNYGGNGGNGTTSNGTNKNNTNGTQTIITTQGGNNTTLIIVICAIGGIMLLAIIVVVILAATGVLFGKKDSNDTDDVEALKAKLEAAELKEKLAALEEGAVEAAPADEVPAEELPETNDNEQQFFS